MMIATGPGPARRTPRRVGGRPVFVAAVLVTSLPMFMTALDNLVVIFALPVIRVELGGSLEMLGWVVNAYTLAFATLLLTASALGDRLGRRRVFATGIGVFTAASAAAALATDPNVLIAARAVQGAAAAAIMPLSLTLVAAGVPPARRAVAIGIWGGVSGLGVALGPVIGGAVVEGLAWQWIFWLNIPIGIVVLPLVLATLRESYGPDRGLDPLGLVLASGGVLALVWAVVRADSLGWGSTPILAGLLGGAALLGVFLTWQRRATTPLLPLRLFKSRGFSAANAAQVAFSFGVFGSVFFLAQFLQVVQGYSPLVSGIRTMPWTMAPLIVAPLAGLLTARLGSRALIAFGLTLQAVALAWLAAVSTPGAPYLVLVVPLALAGVGMGIVLPSLSNAVLASVPDHAHGKASGTISTMRELGVTLGVAVLTAVFAANGSYTSGPTYVAGLQPAVYLGAAVVLAGAVIALALHGRRAPEAAAEPTPA